MIDNDGVLGLVIGVLGIALAVLFFVWQRRPKTLDWYLIGNEALLAEASAASVPELWVKWRDAEVKAPRVLFGAMNNGGAREIRPEDYDEGPTLVSEEEGVKLLSVEAFIALEGRVRSVSASLADNRATLERVLLNRGDKISFTLLTDGKAKASIECRLAGQDRSPRRVAEPALRTARRSVVAVLLGSVCMLALARTDLPGQVLGPAAAALLVAIFVAATWI